MRITFLVLAIFIGYETTAQIEFGELKYTGIGSYVMPAFHRLDDGTMIAAFEFHGGHEFCGANKHRGTKTALVKYDRDGNIIWQTCFTESWHRVVRVMPYPDGSIACMGYSNKEIPGKGRYSRFWIRLIDEDGSTRKEFYADGMKSTQETIRAASVCPDGGFIGAGKIVVPSDYPGEEIEVDMYVIKVDKDGEVEWEKTIDNAFWDGIGSIIPSKGGGYLASGWCQFKGDKKKRNAGTAHIIKFSDEGDILWHRNYGTGHYDYISGLAEKENGDIVFIGRETGLQDIRHNSCASQGFWIAGLNHKGHLKWENFMVNRSTGTGAYSRTDALLILDDGRILVGGADVNDLVRSKLWMAEFDEQGELLHENNFGEKTCHGVYNIVPVGDHFLVAGWNQGYNTFDHKTKTLGIHSFDTWTMEMKLEPRKGQKVGKEKIADSTVSQTIAYQDQSEENPPHLFVKVHQPMEEQIHVYPNPAHEFISIRLTEQKKDVLVQVYSTNGKLQITSEGANTDLIELNIGGLKRGAYLVVLQADGITRQLKFIKE